MCRYFHPVENHKMPPKDHPRYDPVYNIRSVLNTALARFLAAYCARQHVTIDESMIKYKGTYVHSRCAVYTGQTDQAQPESIFLQLFVHCCARYCLFWYLYVGKEYTPEEDRASVSVCDQLINMAELTGVRGRVLTTDNWYTSIVYGWTPVGAVMPTDKMLREKLDIPFHKLSKGAKESVSGGWYRQAVIKMKTKHGKTYYIQCTT